MKKTLALTFEKASFIVVLWTICLVPFIFIPGAVSSIGAVKGAVLYIGIFLAATLWLIAAFIEGSIFYIRSRVLALLAGAAALGVVSALTSANTHISLWGRGFVLDSIASLIALGVLLFLVSYFAREKRRVRTILFTFFFVGSGTLLLQFLLFIFRTAPFMLKYFSAVTVSGTVVGSWTDYALFTAFMFTFALLMFELFLPRGIMKIVSIATVVLSIISLAFLNFAPAWILILIVSLLLFIYKMSVERSISYGDEEHKEEHKSNASFPFLSFGALVIGLFFVLSASSVGTSLARFAQISFSDVRPSLGTSIHIARASLLHDPIFGVGSGRYANAWNLYHPASVNTTSYWNSSFDNGYDAPLTMLVTLGMLPSLLIFAVFILLLWLGVRVVGKSTEDRVIRFIATTALVLFALIFLDTLLSVPGFVGVMIIFVLGGLLVGMAQTRGIFATRELRFLTDPRISFFAVTGMTVIILIGCASIYLSATKYISIVFYNRALAAGDTATAIRRLSHADALSHNDLYYRTAAAVFVNDFTTASAATTPDTNKLQSDFSAAEQNANASVAWDSTSPANWYALAQVYQLAISGNKDAAGNAASAIAKAQALNPQNPLFELTLAQVSLTQKDETGALGHIQKAIALKKNYLDAYLLEAQIKQNDSDLAGAADVLKQYTQVAPYDDQGFGVLGIAYLNEKDYTDALAAFQSARSLNPREPNYFALYIKALYQSGNVVEGDRQTALFKQQFPNQASLVNNLSQVQATLPDETTSTSTPDQSGSNANTAPTKTSTAKKQ